MTIWHSRCAGGIGANKVAGEHVQACVLHKNAVFGVARYHIARAGAGTANEIAVGAEGEPDPVPAVWDGGGSAGVDADIVSGNRIAARTFQVDSRAAIARNHIARAGRCAADRASSPRALYEDAV